MDFLKNWYSKSVIILFLLYLIIFFLISDNDFAIDFFLIVIISHILIYFPAGMVVQIFLKNKNGESLGLYELLLNSFALLSFAYILWSFLRFFTPFLYIYVLTLTLLIMTGVVYTLSNLQYKTSKKKSFVLGIVYVVSILIFTFIIDYVYLEIILDMILY